MGYVETMFGHQSEINAIDSWRKERAVTGGRDRTVSAYACWRLIHDFNDLHENIRSTHRAGHSVIDPWEKDGTRE